MATFAGIRTSGGKIVQPIGDEVIKQFQFSHATAGLNTGVVAYTPNAGDVLLDCWIEIDTAFNGTTPKADVGDFVSANDGLFSFGWGPIDLTQADSVAAAGQTNLLSNTSFNNFTTALAGAASPPHGVRITPGKFTNTVPIKLVVSQDGTKGGAATGATAGSGVVYFVVGTPQ